MNTEAGDNFVQGVVTDRHRQGAKLFLGWPHNFFDLAEAYLSCSNKNASKEAGDRCVDDLAQFIANWEAMGKANAQRGL
jgi:hypothetical protein